jgi:hypothetical protein
MLNKNIKLNNDYQLLNDTLSQISNQKIDQQMLVQNVDYTLCTRNFSIKEDLQRHFLNNFAATQLLIKLRLSKSYLDRCSDELAKDNIKYWMDIFKQKTIILRGIKNNETGAKEFYSVVSKRFNINFDDINSLPIIVDLLKTIPSLFLDSYCYSPMLSELLFTFQDLNVDNKTFCGLSVVNSEVGLSCLHIRPWIKIGNIPIYSSNKQYMVKFKHLGNKNISNQISNVILNIKDAVQYGKLQIELLQKEIIEDTEKELNIINLMCPNVSKRIINVLKNELSAHEEFNKIQLIEEVIKASKLDTLPIFKKFNIQKEIGEYLGLLDTQQITRLQKIFQ